MSKVRTLIAKDGISLHVREFGNPAGIPLLLIHGWSQSHLCWVRQYASELAREFRLVALDLRGHGQSDKPQGTHWYSETQRWADDIALVLAACELERPILVGWSYGSLVAALYVQHHGDHRIAGINFAGGACRVSPAHIGTLLGSVFADILPLVTTDDLGENIAGMRRFLDACVASPLSVEDRETALAWNIVVPGHVRAGLLATPLDTTDILARLNCPLLLSHGRSDAVTLPAMAELMLASCPGARVSWYDEVGHSPFLEAPMRFNRELAAFAREARGGD